MAYSRRKDCCEWAKDSVSYSWTNRYWVDFQGKAAVNFHSRQSKELIFILEVPPKVLQKILFKYQTWEMPKQANAAANQINAFVQKTRKEVWLKHNGRMQRTLNIYSNFPLNFLPLNITTQNHWKSLPVATFLRNSIMLLLARFVILSKSEMSSERHWKTFSLITMNLTKFYVGCCTYRGNSECPVSGAKRLKITFENNVPTTLNPKFNR